MQIVIPWLLVLFITDEPMFSAKIDKAELPAKLAEPVRKLLDEQALVVRNGESVVMRIWFRSEIPVKASEEQIKNGLTYREIPEGALVGAIELAAKFVDFRKQELPAGVYTLRFAVQPDIGDHTDTAPHPEFCLLCPAAADRSDEEIEKKKLIELSSEVNEGRHPAVLLLWPNNAKESAVKVVDKGSGVFVATFCAASAGGGRQGHAWLRGNHRGDSERVNAPAMECWPAKSNYGAPTFTLVGPTAGGPPGNRKNVALLSTSGFGN